MSDPASNPKEFLDFDRPIIIYDWKSDEAIASVNPRIGLLVMGRSNRFDRLHATAAVRVLTEADADHLHIPRDTPVTFKQ